MKRIWLPVLAAAMVLLPAVEQAQAVDLGGAPVIRKPLQYRKGRFSVSPVIGTTVGDPYWTSMLLGASADYHILDWLAIGIDFRYALGFTTPLLDQIESELAAAREVGEDSGEADVITVSRIDWLVTANLQLIPIYGKFSMFDALEVAYDLHFIAGVGYAGTVAFPESSPPRQIGKTDGSVVPMFGVGFRLFFTSWFAVNLEVRDYLVQMVRAVPEYPNSASIPGKSFEHNLAVSLGFSFFFPTEVRNAAD